MGKKERNERTFKANKQREMLQGVGCIVRGNLNPGQ
jgi:hypothetical protein